MQPDRDLRRETLAAGTRQNGGSGSSSRRRFRPEVKDSAEIRTNAAHPTPSAMLPLREPKVCPTSDWEIARDSEPNVRPTPTATVRVSAARPCRV